MSAEAHTLPTVHLNGTPRDMLVEQLCDAGNAVMEAMHKLGQASPNGRDYYPQGDAALRLALLQHDSRMTRLRSVYQELQAIAEAIANI